ncbi:MAG: HAD family phosphatase [Candidatus Altiarchaeota archaeon]|nr:HAD family phosphatase [Candidatus Altiarchaeota archaeon]
MIKTVLFDFGGVLFTSGTEKAIELISKETKVNFERANELFGQKNQKEGWKLRRGLITSEKFWDAVRKENPDTKKIKKLWFESYTLNESALELVKKLRKYHRVIAFSGNLRERVEYLDKKYNMMKEFDNHFFSYEVGYNKIDIEFYKKAIENLKIIPEETLFIEDQSDHLDIASKLGIRGILFSNVKALEERLHELKISFDANK